MATKIGSLYSELGFRVDYRKLREYEKRLKGLNRRLNDAGDRFQKQVQQNQKKTLTGFSAIEKRVNKHRGQLWQMRQDYRRINDEFKQGNISHERRTRLLTDITRQYSQQKRHIRDINRAHSKTPIGRLHAASKAMQRPVSGSGGGVSGGGHYRAGATAGIVSRFAGPAALAGAAVVGTGMAAQASNRRYQRYESVRSGLTIAEGSREKANAAMLQLAKQAEYLGQQLLPLAEGYKSIRNNLKGSGIEDRAMDLNFALNAYGTALGLNQQQLGGIQLALGQVASVGHLQGDELNQLSEHGISRGMIAESMGMSTADFTDAVSEGQITVQKLFPAIIDSFFKQARVDGALETRRQSTQAEANRAINTGLYADIALNKSGLNEYFKQFYEGLQELVKNALPVFEEIGEAFKSIAESSRESLGAFGNILGSIGRFSDSLDGIEFGNKLASLADFLNLIATNIDSLADTVNLLRSDKTWGDKLSGVADTFVDQLKLVAETFINGIIGRVNSLPFVDIGPVDFTSVRAVKANSSMLMMAPETIQSMQQAAKRMPQGLNQYGGVDPTALPFGPPRDRQGNTYNVEAPVSIQVDGYNKDPDELVNLIQERWDDNINNLIRSTSMNEPSQEKS